MRYQDKKKKQLATAQLQSIKKFFYDYTIKIKLVY